MMTYELALAVIESCLLHARCYGLIAWYIDLDSVRTAKALVRSVGLWSDTAVAEAEAWSERSVAPGQPIPTPPKHVEQLIEQAKLIAA